MRESIAPTIAALFAAAVLLAALAACPSRDVASLVPELEGEQLTEIPINAERKLDLIFIVDDSKSMEPNQAALVANFPRFIEILGGISGGLPSVHIGVLSTDVGAVRGIDDRCDAAGHDGRFVVGAQDGGCPGIDDPWLVDVVDEATGERIRNYDGDLADRFTCMASLGTDGCGFEQPLESLRRALERRDNEDFFRDDALLGVVILSDEDDCSVHDTAIFGPPEQLDGELGPLDSFRCTEFGVTCDAVACDDYPGDLRCQGTRQNCVPLASSPYMHSPAHFADLLVDFKGDPDRVVVANIIGDPEPFSVVHEVIGDTTYAKLAPSCETSDGVADPGVRLDAFLEEFPESQRERTSICDGDLSGPIEEIAHRFIHNLPTSCVGGRLRDVDPDEPGIQPECVVADVIAPGTADEDEILLPECDRDASNAPCWYMQEDPTCSAAPTGLALEIERGDTLPPPRATLRARCVADG